MRTCIFFFIMVLTMAACEQKSTYEKMVEKGRKSTVQNDSLFLGISLGMERSAFFERCWELNREGICRQGTQNQTVEYSLKKGELKHPATMNFYPEFHEGKIAVMQAWYAYDAWAPWNKKLAADSLIFDVKDLMEKWYGKGFVVGQDSTKRKFLAKVDGNREIRISKTLSDREVKVEFRDLKRKIDGQN